MKFIHMADCHIGGWREERMEKVSAASFRHVIDFSIKSNVDFVLISGDLFNTAIPPIDKLRFVVKELKKLKDSLISVYAVSGSHDFSPSGKTMIDVLDEAGLLVNVVKGRVEEEKLILDFTVDKKAGVKIAGMIGLRGMLEKTHYKNLDRTNLENEQGFKIFMFHTAINELKPKDLEKMESLPMSLLPKGFNYYAGGHVHIVSGIKTDKTGIIVYPGPVYPNNFFEIEKLKHGGFYYVTDEKAEYIPIIIKEVVSLDFGLNNKSPLEASQIMFDKIDELDFKDKIVTLRLSGMIRKGSINDLNLSSIFEKIYEKGAYFVMKSSSGVSSEEFEEIKMMSDTIENIETTLIKEHLSQIHVDNLDKDQEENAVKELLVSLDCEKAEGEKKESYEERMKASMKKALFLDKVM